MAERSDFDKAIYVLVTAVSNCACLPAVVILWRRRFAFEFFISVFTFLTSFMYHFCDSIRDSAWLEEHQWHKLDNVFSIQCFACLFIYLSCLPTLKAHLLMNFFSMGIIMLLQEKNPWNELYTIVPVLVVVLFFLSITVARFMLKNNAQSPSWLRIQPKYHRAKMTCGFLSFFAALGFFWRGLDDKTDPYRFFHGCWHMSVGLSAYFFWWAVSGPVGTPDLYHWPIGGGMTLPPPSSDEGGHKPV